MAAGKLSVAEFMRCEQKRAANRLRERWKKDPWALGSTIDLGIQEPTFASEVEHWLGDLRAMPAAIVDRLRWKFRRHQLDRRDDEKWGEVLRGEAPKWIEAAGGRAPARENANEIVNAAWLIGGELTSAKRTRADQRQFRTPKGPEGQRPAPLESFDSGFVAAVLSRSRDVLARLVLCCTSDSEVEQVLAALVSYAEAPASEPRRNYWLDLVRSLTS